MNSAILIVALWGAAFQEPSCDAGSAACADAGCDCCEHCGACCGLIKVCRAECSEKEVTHVKYRVECEDFCVPGRSCKFCCEDECGHCQVCKTGTCGKVRTKKKLVKVEVKEKIPVTKCVVEYLCPSCCDTCGAEACSIGEGDPMAAPEEPAAENPAPKSAAPPAPTAHRQRRPSLQPAPHIAAR